MQTIGFILFAIGLIIGLIYGIQLIILAFNTSILWGLGYLFVPLVAPIFIIVHWQETKSPFLRGLLSIPFFIVGALLMPDTAAT